MNRQQMRLLTIIRRRLSCQRLFSSPAHPPASAATPQKPWLAQATVRLNARSTGHKSDEADALQAKGIEVVELDVTDTHSVDQAVAAVVAKAGRIDVLINNAGVASVGVSEAFTDEQATALFDVNVIGLHRVTTPLRITISEFKFKHD